MVNIKHPEKIALKLTPAWVVAIHISQLFCGFSYVRTQNALSLFTGFFVGSYMNTHFLIYLLLVFYTNCFCISFKVLSLHLLQTNNVNICRNDIHIWPTIIYVLGELVTAALLGYLHGYIYFLLSKI